MMPALLSPTRLMSTSVALLFVGLVGCSSMEAREGAQEVGIYTLTSDRVAIYNLAGNAELVSHPGPHVIVEVRRSGPDRALLRVESDPIDGRESLRVLYPDDGIRYSVSGRGSIRVRVNRDGTFGHGGGIFGENVRISDSGGGTEAWADLRVLIPEGSDVAFYLAAGETTANGVSGRLHLDVVSGPVRTSGTVGSLEIDAGTGSIEVVDAEGEVEVDVGSASIQTNGIRGRRLTIDSGSGSVRGEGIDVGTLSVDTGSGSVRFSSVAAPNISVDTGSGSVRLGLLRDVDEVGIETGSGSVELRVPEELGADLVVRTGSGGVQAEVPVQIRSSRRGRFEGVIGDGNGEIRIETGSGGVDILPS